MSFLSNMRQCCGYFCGASACVGIYFFLVLVVFESMNNLYLTEEIQKIPNPIGNEESVKNFVMAFAFCSLVSNSLFIRSFLISVSSILSAVLAAAPAPL